MKTYLDTHYDKVTGLYRLGICTPVLPRPRRYYLTVDLTKQQVKDLIQELHKAVQRMK